MTGQTSPTMLSFDEENARRIFAAYQTQDVSERRRAGRAAVDLTPGERVLDVGCGPGVYAMEVAEDVGPSGHVVGIDNSPDMLEFARRHCASSPLGAVVELRQGEATALPVEDGTFDAAVSVQVLEYVQDVDAALSEIHRALKPGGRALIWDTDWHSIAWHSQDPDRMRRVLTAWDEHLTHPNLTRSLRPLMHRAGFEVTRLEPYTTLNLQTAGTYSGGLIPLVERFVAGRAGITADEASAWANELRDLDERGKYFYCGLQCYAVGVKR